MKYGSVNGTAIDLLAFIHSENRLNAIYTVKKLNLMQNVRAFMGSGSLDFQRRPRAVSHFSARSAAAHKIPTSSSCLYNVGHA